MANGSQSGAGGTFQKTKAEDLNALINALNTDTEMILVAVGADSDSLAPVVWARAGYIVPIAAEASGPETLRVMLQEVMNHGRDAAIVTSLDEQALTVETVHRMVSTYRQAGDDVWAVSPELDGPGQPVLLGRRMIELFLRGNKTQTAVEILNTNRVHVRTIDAGDPLGSAGTSAEKGWVAPWDLPH